MKKIGQVQGFDDMLYYLRMFIITSRINSPYLIRSKERRQCLWGFTSVSCTLAKVYNVCIRLYSQCLLQHSQGDIGGRALQSRDPATSIGFHCDAIRAPRRCIRVNSPFIIKNHTFQNKPLTRNLKEINYFILEVFLYSLISPIIFCLKIL